MPPRRPNYAAMADQMDARHPKAEEPITITPDVEGDARRIVRAIRDFIEPGDASEPPALPPAALMADPDQESSAAAAYAGADSMVKLLITALADPELSIPDRAAVYAVARALKLKLERAIKPVTKELADAMATEGMSQLGPLRLGWRSVDPRYVCNDPDNWTDDGVQDAMRGLAGDPATAPYIRTIPAHFEIDTRALGAAMAIGDEQARTLYNELKSRRWRVEEARTPELKLDEAKS